MDRTERILDLIHVLRNANRPQSLQDLKEHFEDYRNGSEESLRRKFERDKADLAKLGFVLRYDHEDGEDAGYSIDVEATYLPDGALTESEYALLAGAAKAALADASFPFRAALRLALAKLDACTEDADESLSISLAASEETSAAMLETLAHAVTSRKTTMLEYKNVKATNSERNVDPYGLFLKLGAWYLAAMDHRSGDIRLFRVGRIARAEVNTKRPGSADFQVPEDFDLSALRKLDPLSYRVHEPVIAKIWVDPVVQFLVDKAWGLPVDDVYSFETTHINYVIERLLELGNRAELREPDEARRELAEIGRKILRAHGEEA